MALLTDEQLHAIRDLIRAHHSAFIVNTIGPGAVAPELLKELSDRGLIDVEITTIEDAYLYGQALAAADNPAVAGMSLPEFRQWVRRNPIPLTDQEQRSVDFAQHQAAQYAVGLGNRIDTQTGQMLIEADKRLAQQTRSEIQTATATNIAQRRAIKELVSDLKWSTKDWARDWDRIAITEKHNAMQHGMADHYIKRFGPGVRVFKRPTPGACQHCRRLHLGPDGQPRIFRLRDLERNGTNYGRKSRDWLPIVGSTHPHCFPEGTPVETAKGPTPIEQVEPGDRVLTHLGTWEPVTHTWQSWFHGDLVAVETKGRRLEATPNHSLLTSDGWRPAEALRDGMNLQSLVMEVDRSAFVDLDTSDSPPPGVERSTFANVLFGFTGDGVPITAVYFDGQLYIGEGKVNQPRADGDTHLEGQTRIDERLVDEAFVGRFELTGLGLRHLDAGLQGGLTPTLGPVGSRGQPLLFRRIEGLHAEFVGLGSITLGNPRSLESGDDGPPGDAEMAGYLLHRRSLVCVHFHEDGTIEFAPVSAMTIPHERSLFDHVGIVNVSLNHYHGPVYNLTVARANSYVANGIVSHNCQCQLIRIPEGWGFDAEGDLVPGGKGGVEYKGGEDLEMALRQEDELRKAHKLQGHTEFQGIPIAIENRKGTVRRWTDAEGNAGETQMLYSYGYVKKTSGADGEEIDCYLGPDPRSTRVFIAHQFEGPVSGQRDDHYDEDKCFLGFPNEESVRRAYLDHMDDPSRLGSITAMDIDHFKRWLGVTEATRGHELKHVIDLEKARPDLEKAAGHKYIRRWKDKRGKWQYEYAEPRGRPTHNDGYTGPIEAGMSLREVERTIQKLPIEHCAIWNPDGEMMFRKSGTVGQIKFDPEEVNKYIKDRDIVFTHNHPGSGCLGVDDMSFAALLDMREVRAVTAKGVVYSLRRPANGWGTKIEGAGHLTNIRQPAKLQGEIWFAWQLATTRARASMDKHISDNGGIPGDSDHPSFSQEMFDGFIAKETFKAVNEHLGKLYGWEITKQPLAEPRADTPRRRRAGPQPPAGPVRRPEQLALFRSQRFTLDLEKAEARGGKYLRREQYTDSRGKRRWRYWYTETAAAREAKAGAEVRLGRRIATVIDTHPDGSLTLELDGQRRRVTPAQWHNLLVRHYGQQYSKSADRRARQAINAVMRHVPRKLLEDLTGTDAERLEQLRVRVPDVYSRLKAAFRRAGVSSFQAQRSIERTLERRGWEPEARALVLGNVIRFRGTSTAELISASESLAGGSKVKSQHVAAIVELRAPGGRPEAFPESIGRIAAAAEKELASLSATLARIKAGDLGAGHALAEGLSAVAVQKLNLLTQAFPGIKDKVAQQAREILPAIASVAPKRAPTTEGSETIVYVAGEGGKPTAMRARYRLVEAEAAIASHHPETFGKRTDYPENVQERAYHRDKAEQAKVIRNAQQLNPQFVVNTNPDAVNGPPLVTAEGIVLGGNSRVMSMQRAYSQHPDKAEQLKTYLADHAHEVGLTPDDVASLKQPILIREVEVADTSKPGLQLLVRQMNESFTQGMDPRTMQVAMGRRLSDATLQTLGEDMEEGETLASFLASTKRSERFTAALFRVGVIDNRNLNQYMRRGTRTLNNDGVTLVSRILVGRTLQSADILSDTGTQMMESIAQSVPAIVQAKASGTGYDIGDDLAVAVDAFNDLQRRATQGRISGMTALDPKMKPGQLTRLYNEFQMLPGIGEPHPILGNSRAQKLMEVLIRKRGPVQMAKVFREYARQAAQNPEGQTTLFGPAATPEVILSRVIDEAMGRAEPDEAMAASLEPGDLQKAGPFIGPRGGKWADAKHTIPWRKPVTQARARAISRAADRAGKHGGEQDVGVYGNIKGKHVRVTVPIEDLNAIEPGDAARVAAYAQKKSPPPPVRLGYNARSAKRGAKLYVADGNHRVAAARAKGHTHIEAIIPVADYERWERKAVPELTVKLYGADVTYRVVSEKDNTVKLSRHKDSDYGPTMPKESVKHFVNDLQGKVDLPPSGNPDIDAVTSGKAQFLGKGDDGLAFKVGDKVVKVSTTVPYQPENPGHRTPEQAAQMLKGQVEVGNLLADKGIPGIQRSTFIRHGDKGFQIKAWVDIPEKFTREQLDSVQDTLIAVHKAGYSINDQIQPGLDAKGNPVMFDVGKASRVPEGEDPYDIYSRVSGDMERMAHLYREHGQEFVRRDYSEGQRAIDRVDKSFDKWLQSNPKFAAHNLQRAVDQRAKELRVVLSGKELDKALNDLDLETWAMRMQLEDAGHPVVAVGPAESGDVQKGAPYVGPRGGLYSDPKLTISYRDKPKAPRVSVKKLLAGNAGIKRSAMPQIVSALVPEFVKELEDGGVKVTRTLMPVSKVKATQNELSTESVRKLIENPEARRHLAKPIIVSAEGHLLDGHHRWAAMRTLDPKSEIQAVQVSLPIIELLGRARAFSKVEFRKSLLDRDEEELIKAGPFIGPRGGKWADPGHTIPWRLTRERPAAKVVVGRREKTYPEPDWAVGAGPWHSVVYSFDGDPEVKPLATVDINEALGKRWAMGSSYEVRGKLREALGDFHVPEGYDVVYRVRSEQEPKELGGRNAGNLEGVVDFLFFYEERDYATNRGDKLTAYAVKLPKEFQSFEPMGGGTAQFQKAAGPGPWDPRPPRPPRPPTPRPPRPPRPPKLTLQKAEFTSRGPAIVSTGNIPTEIGAQTSPAGGRAPGHGTVINMLVGTVRQAPPSHPDILGYDPNESKDPESLRVYLDIDGRQFPTGPRQEPRAFEVDDRGYFRDDSWVTELPRNVTTDSTEMRGAAIHGGHSSEYVTLLEAQDWDPDDDPGINARQRYIDPDPVGTYEGNLTQVKRPHVFTIPAGPSPYTDDGHRRTERAERKRLEQTEVSNRQRPRNTVDVEG